MKQANASAYVFGKADYQLPAVVQGNEQRVRAGFWSKIGRNLVCLPFAEQAVAAYYCALDPATPLQAKAVLLAALAYFIMPVDLVPDFIAGLGFTDDLTVIVTAFGLVRQHVTPTHRDRAHRAIERLKAGGQPD
jgi:uncharacterized membrane protein YkvA (DUF1232 family)